MLKLAYASLDEVPETVRGLCTAAEGSVSLDETKIKTIADVENVLKAKKMEVEAHNATKAKLAPWEKIGKSAEEVQTMLDEYPDLKSNSKTNEDYLNERIPPENYPVMARLLTGGTAALYDYAKEKGFRPSPEGYPTKCAFCYAMRQFLHKHAPSADLAPDESYRMANG